MNKMLDARTGTITLIEGSTLSGKTRKMVELLKDAIKHQVPTLFVSLELTKEQVSNQVSLDETVLVIHNGYIEDICSKARILKADANLKLILIDGLTELYTKHKYCLGRSAILSLIVQQLKKLALELDIAVIITGPANVESEIKNINELDVKIINLNSIRKHQDRF